MESVPLVERILQQLILATETVAALEDKIKELSAENKSLNSEV